MIKDVLLVLFVGCVCAQYAPRRRTVPKEKPGTCPVSDVITTCECNLDLITCNGDYQCPGSQKCCSYGCGCRTSCVDPVKRKPVKRDVCSQPKVIGPCKAAIRRYWFNKKTNTCEQFTYGGCKGNKNNFETKKACQNRCQKNKYSS